MIRKLPCALLVVGMVIGGTPWAGAQPSPYSPGIHAPAPCPAAGSAAATEPTAGPAFFVTVPPVLGGLERAPVLFPHDRHTAVLQREGCGVCHPKKGDRFEFSFPREFAARRRKAAMDSYHQACLGCHTQRSKARQPAGPLGCGECHSDAKARRQLEYLPALPEDYSALRDPYHKECLACHRSAEKGTKHAKALDWKTFHVKERRPIAPAWPEMVFDYAIHDKHQKALEKKCELCHYLPLDLKAKAAAEGREPTGQEWVRYEEEGKSLKDRDSAHRRCLNCHVERQEAGKTAGPVECRQCHTERRLTAKELEGIPRPEHGHKGRILIKAENASQAGVAFNHESHIAASRSCGDCHHRTVDSCGKCHTVTGDKAGGFVTLAEAYHKPRSTWSCVGCHRREQEKPDCAGCHSLRRAGMAGVECASCHSGSLARLDDSRKLPDPATLFPPELKDELEISLLSQDYAPTTVKHREIATRLTRVSNENRLASFFHTSETTICSGCHHVGAVETGKRVPPCSACHTVRNEPTGGVPTLLGAYHQQCLGCHRQMGYPEPEMPQSCTGCHREKPKEP